MLKTLVITLKAFFRVCIFMGIIIEYKSSEDHFSSRYLDLFPSNNRVKLYQIHFFKTSKTFYSYCYSLRASNTLETVVKLIFFETLAVIAVLEKLTLTLNMVIV